MEYNDTLGSFLRTQRKIRAWTLQEMSYKIGAYPDLICRWENDKIVPSAKNLKRLAKLFNLNIYALTRYL